MTKHLRSKVFGVGVLVLLFSLGSQAETVIYPPAETEKDGRDAYPVQLLALALAKSGAPYQLKAYPTFMLQDRAITELSANRNLHVIWTMTSAERESSLLPIRIPIDKGLLGWRLLLIRSADAPTFSAIPAAELKKRIAGQGHDWPDTTILKNDGYRVEVTSNYRALFQMLHNQSIDYFPRSVQEIWPELKLQQGNNFAVEATTALHYPTAMYFFVHKQNTGLAQSIRVGLDAAIADGSFEKLFQKYLGDAIRRARLESRHIIEVANPLLPELTPLGDKRLWLAVPPGAMKPNNAPKKSRS